MYVTNIRLVRSFITVYTYFFLEISGVLVTANVCHRRFKNEFTIERRIQNFSDMFLIKGYQWGIKSPKTMLTFHLFLLRKKYRIESENLVVTLNVTSDLRFQKNGTENRTGTGIFQFSVTGTGGTEFLKKNRK
jgi:hypothetical protein